MIQIDKEIRGTVGDLIEELKKIPKDTPIVLIEHQNSGHQIDYEYATKEELKGCLNVDKDGLNIGFW